MTSTAPETLPAAWYRDEEIFQRERREIFSKHWWPLGRLAQLEAPGSFLAGEIAAWPVFVIRRRGGGRHCESP